MDAGADDRIGFVVSVAYPAGDLVLLVLAAMMLGGGRSDRLSLGLLAAGLLAFAVADGAFAYQSATGAFTSGGLADLGWILGFSLMALAPLTAERGDADAAPARRDAARASAVPYVAVLVAAVVVVWRRVEGGPPSAAEQVMVAVVVMLVLARQFATLRENSQLVEDLAERVGQTVGEQRPVWPAR